MMLTHLLELRKRAIYILLMFFCSFLLCFYFAPGLFHILVKPLSSVLTNQERMIATHITSPLLIPLKLAINLALLSTAPFALLQLWLFIAPALYKQERFYIKNAMISSFLLFCGGVLFCFYLILPLTFQFISKTVPIDVQLMPDISYALDFITRMLLIFGVCFQVPTVCLTLVRLKWVSLQELKKMRPYIIVGSFILGMLLTPDVLSQTMLAVPLYLLYEIGILLAKLSRTNQLTLNRR